MSYVDETIENNNPATWTRTTTDRMSYIVDGNITDSHETSVNASGVQGETTRERMRYDQQNRLEAYGIATSNQAKDL